MTELEDIISKYTAWNTNTKSDAAHQLAIYRVNDGLETRTHQIVGCALELDWRARNKMEL